jgi:hypothetical protein
LKTVAFRPMPFEQLLESKKNIMAALSPIVNSFKKCAVLMTRPTICWLPAAVTPLGRGLRTTGESTMKSALKVLEFVSTLHKVPKRNHKLLGLA